MKHELEALKDSMRNFQNYEETIPFVCNDKEVINKHNNTKQMIIGYNPLQSVMISSNNNIKYISHPIDLYRNAYDEGFINDKELNLNYGTLFGGNKNLITNLQILLKMNKYFLMILIPSYIELDNIYLNKECITWNPIDYYYKKALDEWTGKISFIYKGEFYFDTGLNAKDCKDIDLHIKELNKKVLYTFRNKKHPIMHWLIIGCHSMKLSRINLTNIFMYAFACLIYRNWLCI